jgi:NTP pyrophosphatase (non-canonical NTP hydrolase)
MNLETYKEESARTFAYRKEPLNEATTDMLHCAIGCSTEAGELLDAFKKHIFYGKPLDKVNVGEEIADMMWYITNLARLSGLDVELLLQSNINKLRVRFPDKFTEEAAANRNLNAERTALEGK